MCLLALAVVVKPLAQAIGNHLRCDSYDNIGYDLDHQAHLPSVARMEKGSATSITQVLAQYNKKALPELLLRGGFFARKNPR